MDISGGAGAGAGAGAVPDAPVGAAGGPALPARQPRLRLADFPARGADFNVLFEFEMAGGQPLQLGSGGFGEVYSVRAREPEGARFVRRALGLADAAPVPALVCKVMDRLNADDYKADSASREAHALGVDVRHPGVATNIKTYVDFVAGAPSMAWIIMERADGMPERDDGHGANQWGASRGDFWRLVYHEGQAGRPMSENAAQAVALQVLAAVRFLHSRRAMHRDLKAENLLVFGSEQFGGELVPRVALGDLGTLKFLPLEARIVGLVDGVAPAAPRANTVAVGENPKYVGTCQYIAPELLSVLREAHGRHVVTGASNSFFDADVRRVLAEYGLEIDVYSVGVFVFFCLSGGKLPFWTRGDDGELHELKSLDADQGASAAQKTQAWTKLKAEVFAAPAARIRWDAGPGPAGRPAEPPVRPSLFTAQARSFIERALERDPRRRATADELLAHPWLSGRVQEFERVFGIGWLGGGAGDGAGGGGAGAMDDT